MTDPVRVYVGTYDDQDAVYVGTYDDQDAAKADLVEVRRLYADDVLRTYDAAVVAKAADGKVHVRRHEQTTSHAAWDGAAVGALVGILFPPGFVVTTALGAARRSSSANSRA